MSGHTKGPWRVEEDDQYNGEWLVRDGDDWYVCRCFTDPGFTSDDEDATAEANARLIAASPTMRDYIQKRADAGDAEAAKILEDL